MSTPTRMTKAELNEAPNNQRRKTMNETTHSAAGAARKSTIPDQSNKALLDQFEAGDPFGRTMRVNANGCGCHKCNPRAAWFVTCDICGNKRCPHATDHELACTDSNAPGQKGSCWENYKVGSEPNSAATGTKRVELKTESMEPAVSLLDVSATLMANGVRGDTFTSIMCQLSKASELPPQAVSVEEAATEILEVLVKKMGEMMDEGNEECPLEEITNPVKTIISRVVNIARAEERAKAEALQEAVNEARETDMGSHVDIPLEDWERIEEAARRTQPKGLAR